MSIFRRQMDNTPLLSTSSLQLTCVLNAVIASATVVLEDKIMQRQAQLLSSKKKNKTRTRKRMTIQEIHDCLGPLFFRRAYRMSSGAFWVLRDRLKDGILLYDSARRGGVVLVGVPQEEEDERRDNRKNNRPPITNGPIPPSTRLACALRYFAGASPYDLMSTFGVSYTAVLDSVWSVVHAVNTLPDFFISYPEDHEKQLAIASEFCAASGVQFENCAGAIDGILIWIHKPSEADAKRVGIGRKKFFCGRKGKFGLNCQAVADKRGRILDISIKYGAATSDCLAFEASDLFNRLESGLLAPGLVLFGDNAYLNSSYMATPFPNVGRGSKDDYNYYHSQVGQKSIYIQE